ncbi:hypothetical protein HK102_013562 [Quaeritorhiza haematococci]|nr:hypothetical protein HK102_013562 [Quaeritorhiza haematococci]
MLKIEDRWRESLFPTPASSAAQAQEPKGLPPTPHGYISMPSSSSHSKHQEQDREQFLLDEIRSRGPLPRFVQGYGIDIALRNGLPASVVAAMAEDARFYVAHNVLEAIEFADLRTVEHGQGSEGVTIESTPSGFSFVPTPEAIVALLERRGEVTPSLKYILTHGDRILLGQGTSNTSKVVSLALKRLPDEVLLGAQARDFVLRQLPSVRAMFEGSAAAPSKPSLGELSRHPVAAALWTEQGTRTMKQLQAMANESTIPFSVIQHALLNIEERADVIRQLVVQEELHGPDANECVQRGGHLSNIIRDERSRRQDILNSITGKKAAKDLLEVIWKNQLWIPLVQKREGLKRVSQKELMGGLANTQVAERTPLGLLILEERDRREDSALFQIGNWVKRTVAHGNSGSERISPLPFFQ